ncbi:MAG: type I-MYXAN CRISPR-associated protein Cmx8, partial [Cyanobacteria bacterium P01_E01_bin.42]
AFLAVRSRTEKQVFIDYFVSSLYPFVKEKEFAQFAKELFDDNEWKKIRALTLLALTSQFPSGKSSEEKTEESSINAA